jgi:epimerase transport system membrane fusion protein
VNANVARYVQDLLASGPPARDIVQPNENTRAVSRSGWAIIVLFFGVFGLWSVTAPLNGAVMADGYVKVDGNRKSVQHLDGGIIKELRVSEGDHVEEGQILIILDDTQARSDCEILSQQYTMLRLIEQRLKAEITNSPLAFPEQLAVQRDDPSVASLWQGQLKQFETRRTALDGQRKIIDEKVKQFRAQIEGARAQSVGLAAQLESIKKEKDSLTPLVERGLVARPRILQLERNAFALEGQIGEIAGTIARTEQAISEQSQQLTQLDLDRSMQVAEEMREIQSKLVDVVPKLATAKAVLSRLQIRAPYSGKVVGLNVFSVDGVIGRGEKIMDIVPDRKELIVEAQINVADISEVHPDMRAELRLIAYQQRTTPTLPGKVVQISADRLTDNHNGRPFYVVQVRAAPEELARMPEIHLSPGMPVVVMIPTVERTAFRYLVGPLAGSFDRAFRER